MSSQCHDHKVDADFFNVIVPAAAAVIGAIIARVRYRSELEGARNDVGRLLDQYERLINLPAFEADAQSLEAAVHSSVERLRELEAGRVKRAWGLAVLWVSVTLSIAAASGAYWMWMRDDTWWKVGAIAISVLAAVYLVSGIRTYVKESSAVIDDEQSSGHAGSNTQSGPSAHESA